MVKVKNYILLSLKPCFLEIEQTDDTSENDSIEEEEEDDLFCEEEEEQYGMFDDYSADDDEDLGPLLAELRAERRRAAVVKRFLMGSDEDIDHTSNIKETMRKLEERRQQFSWEESNLKTAILKIKESVEMVIKLKNSPLSTFPPPKGSSLYCDIVNLGLKNCGDLMDLLSCVMVSHERPLNKTDLLTLAQAFALVSSNLNPNSTSAVKKMRMLSLKHLGISNEGLNLLAKLGLCQGEWSWHNERKNLAMMDQDIHEHRIAKFPVNFKYDNLNFSYSGTKNDQTLIVIEYETVDTKHLPVDDAKSFNELVNMFTKEEILLTEDKNSDLRKHLEKVILTCISQVIGRKVAGFTWLLKYFPAHYQHDFSEYSKIKSKIHIEVPLNLNENSNGDHEEILNIMQEKLLESVEGKLHDEQKAQFQKDLKFCREFEDDDEEELVEAQVRIDKQVDAAGEALNWGDQQTSEKQRSALNLRRGDFTNIEQLKYVRNLNFSGLFHVSLNMVIQNFKAMIDDLDFVEDECSLNQIRKLLSKRIITNEDDEIKNRYQSHHKFFLQVGHQFLINAFETFIQEEEEEYDQDEEGATKLLKKFMRVKGITCIYDFENTFQYFDRAQAVAADLIVRTLILEAVDMVVHEGDAKGLQACWLLLIMFFLAREKEQRSKYAREILLNVIQYRGLCTRSRMRHDLYYKVNLSGKAGHCVPNDMLVEWCVKYIKTGYRGQSSSLDYTQIVKMTRSLNLMKEIHEMDIEAMGEDGGIGGGKVKNFLTEDEENRIYKKLEVSQLFSKERKKDLQYEADYRLTWQGLDMSEIERFLKRNQFKYRTETPH